MRRFLCAILCAVMLLSLLPATVLAADSSVGLAAFTDKKEYSGGTFQDVGDGAWYSGSVATVYAKGIMDGVGGGQFAPESAVTWSQAVTIAARLHATYRGKDIPTSDGAWYVQYMDYARENDLLPAICPEDSMADTTSITREGLAVLFRSVLEEKDLPTVNDQAIPDLDSVGEEYRETVSEMFASGIFTGTGDGQFDPEGTATRAQVATIITRLLCPGQRVSHDSRQNPYMEDQMGNFYNGGLCARLGDTIYYVYNAPGRDDAEEYYDTSSIIARTDSGQLKEVYAPQRNNTLELLSVGPDGMLYFVQWDRAQLRSFIKQLNPRTGDLSEIYATTSKNDIRFYLFYDGQLYVYETFGAVYQIGRVENSRLTTLATVPSLNESLYVGDTMYCFGGKLYWLQLAPEKSNEGDRLMCLDLKTGEMSSTITEASEFAYQGATAWSTEFTNGDFPIVLKRRSLAMPELTETVRVLDGEFAQLYDNLYANGSQLYYQVSGAQKLWTISPTGQTEVAATAMTPYYEASAVTSQGIVLMGLDSLSQIQSQGMDIIQPGGTRTNMCAFLGRPYYLASPDQLTATANDASWEPEEKQEQIYTNLTRAYVTPDGAVAVEVRITNTSNKTFNEAQIKIRLDGGAVADQCFTLLGEQTQANSSKVYTFVFPAGCVSDVGNMADMRGSNDSIQLYGSWAN